MLRFRSELLLQHLASMPLLKLLVPFAIGIVLGELWVAPVWLLLLLVVVAGVSELLFHRNLFLIVALVATGWLNRELHERPSTVPTQLRTAYLIRVESEGTMRDGRIRAEGVLECWRNPETGDWYAAEGGLRLVADSTIQLGYGDRLLHEGQIYPFRYGAESYRRLMARRGFVGSCYLTERSLLWQEPSDQSTLHVASAARLKRRLADVDGAGSDAAQAVVCAMTVGDRSGLESELRDAYARSGMAHLLAVSGLHTGIVFALVNLLLVWLPLVRRGHIVRNLLVIVAVWSFVAAAGFPPSAVRAAVMCSILQLALAGSSAYRAMNAWSAAALGMLAWNPLWIGDVGFQLSFVAVAAILLWGVPLGRRCRVRWRVVNGAVQTIIVGLTASVATAPLVSHHFGIVPMVGVWFNPLVILLGTLVVAGGVWVLISPLRLDFVEEGVVRLAELQNSLAERIATMEGAVAEVSLGSGETVALMTLFLLLTVIGGCCEIVPKKALLHVE